MAIIAAVLAHAFAHNKLCVHGLTDGVLSAFVIGHSGAGPHGDAPDSDGDNDHYGATVSYRLWQPSSAGSAMHLGGPAVRPEGMMNHGGPKGEHNHGGATSPQGHVHDPAVPTGSGTALDVALGINGMWWDKQTVAGLKDDNTGGNVVHITPGVRLTVDNWAGFVNVGVPIARELNGIQSEPRLQLSTGISVQF